MSGVGIIIPSLLARPTGFILKIRACNARGQITRGSWPALSNLMILIWIRMMMQKMDKIRIPIYRMMMMSEFVNATSVFEASHFGSAENAQASPALMARNKIRWTSLTQYSAINFSRKGHIVSRIWSFLMIMLDYRLPQKPATFLWSVYIQSTQTVFEKTLRNWMGKELEWQVIHGGLCGSPEFTSEFLESGEERATYTVYGKLGLNNVGSTKVILFNFLLVTPAT